MNLTSNNIKDEGLKHLCDALKNKDCKLTIFHVDHNNMKDKDVKHLRDAVKMHNVELSLWTMQCDRYYHGKCWTSMIR